MIVWTNFENFIENIESFKIFWKFVENLNKNFEIFNKILNFLLLSILIAG